MRPHVVLLLLAIPTLAHSRDLTSFYAIHGFNSPALKAGQYVITLAPHYSRSPFEYSSTAASTQAPPAYQSTSGSNQDGPTASYYELALGSVYGLSDKATLNLRVNFAPAQSALGGSGRSWGRSTSGAAVSSWTWGDAYTQRTDNLFAAMTLSYRPRENVELSLGGNYGHWSAAYSTVSSGTGADPLGSYLLTSSSGTTRKSSSVDVWLSLVLIGD